MPEPRIERIATLRARGFSYADARTHVAGLERVARGTYAATSGLSAEERHVALAGGVLGNVGDVVASHVTAAALWGLPVRASMLDQVHLSPTEARRGKPGHGPGYHLHALRVGPSDRVVRQGLATTSALRTVLDCARSLEPDWGVVIADAALHREIVSPGQLRDAARRIRRLRGAERARTLPDRASAHAESPGETLLRLRMVRMGLEPAEQVELPWVPGNPRVDFLVGGWLVVEFDGRAKYAMGPDPAAAHWAEKVRNDHLTEAGYDLLHVTWAQLWEERQLQGRFERILARGARPPRSLPA